MSKGRNIFTTLKRATAVVAASALGFGILAAVTPATPASAVPIACPTGMDNTWTGATNNDYSTNSNWSLGHFPASGEDICVPAGARVVLAADATMNSMWIEAGATFVVTGVHTITLAGSGTWAHKMVTSGSTYGSFTVNGSLENYGLLDPGAENHSSAGTIATTGVLFGDTGSTIHLDWFDNNGVAGTSFDRINSGSTMWTRGNVTLSAPNNNMTGAASAFTPITFSSNAGPNGTFSENVAAVTLTEGYSATAYTITPASPTASISGTITNDWDYSSTNDAGEPPIAGVAVYVDYDGDSTYDVGEPTATTASNGTYTITGVGSGTWNVRISSTSVAVSTQPATALVVGTTAIVGVNPVVNYPGVIVGTIRDGSAAPVAGVTVFADTNNDGVRQATEQQTATANNGTYALKSLVPATYNVRISTSAYSVVTPIGLVAVTFGATLNHNGVVGPIIVPGPPIVSPPTPTAPTPPVAAITAPVHVNPDGTTKDVPTAVSPVYVPTAVASSPDGLGSWTLARDGGVFTAGTAGFFGSLGGAPLNAPAVGLSPTTDGQGYYIVASDGGVFAFGNAKFEGSMGGKPLNQPVKSLGLSCDSSGYYLVAGDGGVFTFGNVGFYGSMAGTPLNQAMVGIVDSCGTNGYWTFAADGGVFSFGDAKFYGSLVGRAPAGGVVGMISAPDGKGYWLIGADKKAYAFGSAVQ